jgi:spore coat polysaccharide biosynthesis protein SpsF
MNNEVQIIIQARMGSSRLPGKVLMDVCGVPSIIYQVNRLRDELGSKYKIVVATSTSEKDDVLCKRLEQEKIKFFRGSEDDVLSRFVQCVEGSKAKYIVRLNADCPLICPRVVDKTVLTLLDHKGCDYASTILDETYPLGMHVEAMTIGTLEMIDKIACSDEEREHVTPSIYRNPDIFSMLSVTSEYSGSQYRVTVDYAEDLFVIRAIANHFAGRRYFNNDIIDFLDSHPEIAEKNAFLMKKQKI